MTLDGSSMIICCGGGNSEYRGGAKPGSTTQVNLKNGALLQTTTGGNDIKVAFEGIRSGGMPALTGGIPWLFYSAMCCVSSLIGGIFGQGYFPPILGLGGFSIGAETGICVFYQQVMLMAAFIVLLFALYPVVNTFSEKEITR